MTVMSQEKKNPLSDRKQRNFHCDCCIAGFPVTREFISFFVNMAQMLTLVVWIRNKRENYVKQ